MSNLEWYQNENTIKLKKHLRALLEEAKDNWTNGDYTGDTVEKTALKSAEMAGWCDAVISIIEMLEEPKEE